MFRCRSTVYREDVTLEDWEIISCQDQVGYRFPRGLVESNEPHSVYAGTLWEYSNRKLSFDTDVINAFTGVLEILHRQMVGNDDLVNTGSRSICGLPTAICDLGPSMGASDSSEEKVGCIVAILVLVWLEWTGFLASVRNERCRASGLAISKNMDQVDRG